MAWRDVLVLEVELEGGDSDGLSRRSLNVRKKRKVISSQRTTVRAYLHRCE